MKSASLANFHAAAELADNKPQDGYVRYAVQVRHADGYTERVRAADTYQTFADAMLAADELANDLRDGGFAATVTVIDLWAAC